MTYAILNENNQVVNVIQAESLESIPLAIAREKLMPLNPQSLVGVGWVHGDNGFFDPLAVAPKPEVTLSKNDPANS